MTNTGYFVSVWLKNTQYISKTTVRYSSKKIPLVIKNLTVSTEEGRNFQSHQEDLPKW